MKAIFLYIFLIAVIVGCETTITPDLDNAAEIIVVDAWVNQKMERQEIRVTRSQPYFNNTVPSKISGATVFIEDLNSGEIYTFQEGTDNYYWDPEEAPLGHAGHEYRLSVSLEGEVFEAFARLGRVPPIDTIIYKYKPEDLLFKEGYFNAEFVAADPVGEGDAYWVKAWKNGTFLGKPEELNMVYDGGFSKSNAVDGQVFLLPIRRDFVNPLDRHPENNNEFIPPYLVGDSLSVEIHSLDPLAFDFLFGVYFHINRPGGFAELFSFPLANATTNLKNTDPTSTIPVAGFFNVAAVSARGSKLTQQTAEEAKLLSR